MISTLSVLLLLLQAYPSHGQDEILQPARVSCNAAYSAPCARTNSEWLAVTTAARLSEGGLENVTDGFYNMDTGFYPFVLEKSTGICVAHGGNPSLVGQTIDSIFRQAGIAYASAEALHSRFIAAAERGGDWVQYLWSDGGRVNSKLAFVVPLLDNSTHYLGVGYEDEPLPPDLPCSSRYDSWCSRTNVRSLVGQAQFRLNQAESLENFEATIFDLSFDDAFRIDGDFYTFMYSYDGRLKSHAILHEFFGDTLWEIFAARDIGTVEEGMQLHEAFVAAADGLENGWVQYQWHNGINEATYTKIAYIVKTTYNGVDYYLGAGYDFAPDNIATGPLGTDCSADSNELCAFHTTLQLSSHALSHAISSPLTVDGMFWAMSVENQFRMGEFYVFAYDFNQTCVSHGLNQTYAGMNLTEVFQLNDIPLDADLLHREFLSAAKQGGGWVLYDWLVPGVPGSDFQKISYIFRMSIDGRDYYGGVGFNHKQYPIEIFSDSGRKQSGERVLCSVAFGLNCSEVNARALLGQALAELTMAASEARVTAAAQTDVSLEDILDLINQEDEAFRVNDFFVMVFSFDKNICVTDDGSGCCLAHGSDPGMVNLTWQEILSRQDVTTIQGIELHRKLMNASNSGGTSIEYPWEDLGIAQTKRSWTTRFRRGGESFYVVAEYLMTSQPPTCDACPDDMECTSDDQSFCTKKPDLPHTRPVPIIVVCAVGGAVGLLLVILCKDRQSRRKVAAVEKEMAEMAEKLEQRMVGIREVHHDMPLQSPEKYREQVEANQSHGRERAAWYWEEDGNYIGSHKSSTVLPNSNFVGYTEEISGQIEHAFQLYMEGRGFGEFHVDLTDKVQKINNAHTGAVYEIDFGSTPMKQRNVFSANKRNVQRVEIQMPLATELLPSLPDGIDFSQDGEDLLPTFRGQVIQVSKESDDKQWYYGNVLYDPILNDSKKEQTGSGRDSGGTLNEALAKVLLDRPTSGWFPKAVTRPADVKVMHKLLNELGGEGVESLKPPWDESTDSDQLRVTIPEGTEEYEKVADFFLAALYSQSKNVTVCQVERVQNKALWQSYAVKKQSVKTRDLKKPQHRVNNHNPYDVERAWLFHGTAKDVIPKIEKQGFNRAFAGGTNAVRYGRGVYFAHDASYSSHIAYSKPDAEGIQRMFLCRVVVGDWCAGTEGQLIPGSKPYNALELFDTTVDNVKNPSIYVVYHDAQAYPEYLVSFKRKT